MHIRRMIILAILPILLVSCNQVEEEAGVESIETGSQDYLNQALVCSMYFTYSGNKKAAELTLMNAILEVSQNENLNLLSIEDLEEITGSEIQMVKDLFGGSEVSKREASYYLISDNECLIHASMGAIWGLLNQDGEIE